MRHFPLSSADDDEPDRGDERGTEAGADGEQAVAEEAAAARPRSRASSAAYLLKLCFAQPAVKTSTYLSRTSSHPSQLSEHGQAEDVSSAHDAAEHDDAASVASSSSSLSASSAAEPSSFRPTAELSIAIACEVRCSSLLGSLHFPLYP